ncbi:MAG TPA: hypothetical protein VMB84_10555 [Stellaceae bacterium]|nr:hypothetical protein [Stellaceae bacterium]
MAMWLLVGILILGELAVLSRIPAALLRGSVPLNPLGWFGYQEFLEVSVERRSAPAAYWVILGLVAALALVVGTFIYVLVASIG